MGPMVIKYGVAYREASTSQEREPEEKFECDFDDSDEVVRRTIQLLEEGKLTVVMFSYIEGLDTTKIDWQFVEENEFTPTTRGYMLSFLQGMKDHNESWQPGGQYPQSGFQTAQEEKEWFSEIISGTMDLVQNSNDVGYVFMEKYYGKHPQAQGHDCGFDEE